jgi:hypothetical protein
MLETRKFVIQETPYLVALHFFPSCQSGSYICVRRIGLAGSLARRQPSLEQLRER